ncbi:hypothetical protein V3C99_004432 [Haemonchus contortus]
MAVFLAKTVERDENKISFTYRYRISGDPGLFRDRDKTEKAALESEPSRGRHDSGTDSIGTSSGRSGRSKRYFDPNYNYLDPEWMKHCEEILKRSEVLNERLRKQYGIVPEKYPVDSDTRPSFLRTPDEDRIVAQKARGRRSARTRDGKLRPPYTPFPRKTDKATRDLARLIVKGLARPGEGEDKQFRVTSTMSPIAGLGPSFNAIRRTQSEPTVTRASTVITRSDLIATKASTPLSLPPNLSSLIYTSSSSTQHPNARSSSAHSRLTPQRRSHSPTISDVVQFRNRIGALSDFLRNPRHKPPRPVVRSNSDASTQQGGAGSTSSEQ